MMNWSKKQEKRVLKSLPVRIELFLDITQKETSKEIDEKKENIKATLYNELRNELATKEFVRAEINEVKAEINEIIGISIFALTIFNPNFIMLMEKLFK